MKIMVNASRFLFPHISINVSKFSHFVCTATSSKLFVRQVSNFYVVSYKSRLTN